MSVWDALSALIYLAGCALVSVASEPAGRVLIVLVMLILVGVMCLPKE